jgi:hypothetical protein
MSTQVDESWGPAVERRARRRRWPKVLAALLVLLLVAAIAFPWWASRQVGRVEVDGLADPGRPLHILVAGSDSREELTPEEQGSSAPAASEASARTRSSS